MVLLTAEKLYFISSCSIGWPNIGTQNIKDTSAYPIYSREISLATNEQHKEFSQINKKPIAFILANQDASGALIS